MRIRSRKPSIRQFSLIKVNRIFDGVFRERFSALPYTRSMLRILRAVPVDRLKLLVFDLDGTLIDSARDLANSVNSALDQMGRPPLSDELIASFVGNGAAMLVRQALAAENHIPPDEVHDEEIATAYSHFLAHYREHLLDNTFAYPGVAEALKELNGRFVMAVLTNKPVRPARRICEGLGFGEIFRVIYGGDSFPLKKPDPMGLNAILAETGVRADETMMIGDSKVDVLTARNAGTWSMGCQFGFGTQNLHEEMPDILVDHASDWTMALGPARMGVPL
jgi:phosphoglycolate phosphatase